MKNQLDAGRRERFARQFTESVEHIEASARYSALSPAHDVRGDRAEIRARMAVLDVEVGRAGEAAVGPGRYALGRGHLVVDEDTAALDDLQGAWQHGFREPRVAYALALGHLYRQGLLGAERIEDREQREVERSYRDPALAYA